MGLLHSPFSSPIIPQRAAIDGPKVPAEEPSNGIPLRKFGRHEVKVSALGFGGHHLGDAENVQVAIRLVQGAVDNGITFFDNCWEYHLGKSEDWMGQGLKGRRNKVFLMTKVCTHGREAMLGMQMLEQSLRRLQTDHLDLWQIHGVSFENDPELFIRQSLYAACRLITWIYGRFMKLCTGTILN